MPLKRHSHSCWQVACSLAGVALAEAAGQQQRPVHPGLGELWPSLAVVGLAQTPELAHRSHRCSAAAWVRAQAMPCMPADDDGGSGTCAPASQLATAMHVGQLCCIHQPRLGGAVPGCRCCRARASLQTAPSSRGPRMWTSPWSRGRASPCTRAWPRQRRPSLAAPSTALAASSSGCACRGIVLDKPVAVVGGGLIGVRPSSGDAQMQEGRRQTSLAALSVALGPQPAG